MSRTIALTRLILSNTSKEHDTRIEDLVKHAIEHGFTREEAEKTIKKLIQAGELFSPRKGYVRKVGL